MCDKCKQMRNDIQDLSGQYRKDISTIRSGMKSSDSDEHKRISATACAILDIVCKKLDHISKSNSDE